MTERPRRSSSSTPRTRWERLEELFEQAAGTRRGAPGFLDTACGGDAALRAEVEALLAASVAGSGPFDRTVRARRPPAAAEADPWLGRAWVRGA